MSTARAERNTESVPIRFDTTPLKVLHIEYSFPLLRYF